ncbi:Lysophospholipase L1 [Chryseobacterium piscicola]|uniref:Lysophospholipase L1 n=1 Tax=Chryseobacterium piscicola TaxID=551459 RepID=A0A1N7LQM5_9FLAO|nr:GDSL-type esterase/lipase family protein [Chryseobacterium piscicola]PQA91851.1 peptidoglycan-binding protein [Chryseobacterium piscicola]SIS76153.1 Lysophospholipase L1 [Chryseobacterium piscicola]
MKLSLTILPAVFFAFSLNVKAQNIENEIVLKPFFEKLNKNEVNHILFIGDSHIQADHLTGYLRKKFQNKYGNAGRGLVFPYQIANTNGAEDFVSVSNQPWETFRLVHEQKIFPQIGASGFVIGNKENSFLEIAFKNPDDSFDKVVIYNDSKMSGGDFYLYTEKQSLKDFIQKKTEKLNHTAIAEQTFHEIVSKYNTTTTKLRALNGDKILNPKEGFVYKIERNFLIYNPDFEQNIDQIGVFKFSNSKKEVDFKIPQNIFLLKTNNPNGNIFYGFQFLKNVNKGVVFNTVGVNGATYNDFLKFPLQLEQLSKMKSDVLIIALGTNEAFGKVEKEEFQKNVADMISKFRNENPALPILLISPPDNSPKENRTIEVIGWIEESAIQNNTAFFNLFEASGGKGSFKKAQSQKEASGDGVHYLKPGYEKQAEVIWKALQKTAEN